MIRHSDDLKLTDKQIETLEKLSSNSKKALVDLHAQIAKEEIEIQDLLRSGSDDLAAVKRHADALSKARSAVFEERISNFLEARKVLTADQKKLVKETFPRIGSMLD
jgi:Spy/CpxP family protein refolding chaperone